MTTRGRKSEQGKEKAGSNRPKVERPHWNNGPSWEWPAIQRDFEDQFSRNNLMDMFDGSVSGKFQDEEQEPLFCYCFQDKVRKREHDKEVERINQEALRAGILPVLPDVEETLERPGANFARLCPPEERIILHDLDTYHKRLDDYRKDERRYRDLKKEHRERSTAAIQLLTSMLGPKAMETIQPDLNEGGAVEAWKALCAINTPKSETISATMILQRWESLSKPKAEAMITFFTRMDRLIHEMEAVDEPRTDKAKVAKIRTALLTDKEGYRLTWKHAIDKAVADCAGYRVYNTVRGALVDADNEIQVEDAVAAKASADERTDQVEKLRKEVKELKAKLEKTDLAMTTTETAAKSTPETAKKAPDHSKVECYHCHTLGHIAKNCPTKPKSEKKEASGKTSGGSSVSSTAAKAVELKVSDTVLLCMGEGVWRSDDRAVTALAEVFDSGCTSNMSGDKSDMTDMVLQEELVKLGDASTTLVSKGRGRKGELENTMYVPELGYTLISLPQFDKAGKYTILGGGKAVVVDRAPLVIGEVIMTGTLKQRGLYERDEKPDLASVVTKAVVPEKPSDGVETVAAPAVAHRTDRHAVFGSFGTTRPGATTGMNIKRILHRRLGHINESALEKMLKEHAVLGAGATFETVRRQTLGVCDACMRGKMAADPVPPARHCERGQLKPMEKIAMDPVPMTRTSLQHHDYVTVGVDLATNYAWAIPSKTKDVQARVVDHVVNDIAGKYGHQVKTLLTDRDSVYLDRDFQVKCRGLGISCEQSPPYVHEHNGVVERVIRTLMEATRVALIDAALPTSYWEYALAMMIRAYNSTLHPQADTKTPHEKLTGKPPDISLLRPFGVPCYYYVHPDERQGRGARFKPRALHGRIVGYADTVPGAYLVLTDDNPPVIRVRKQVVAIEGEEGAVMRGLEETTAQENEEPDEAEEEPPPAAPAPAPAPEPRRSARTPVPNARYAAAVTESPSPKNLEEAFSGPDEARWRVAAAEERENYQHYDVLRPVQRHEIPKGATILDLKQVLVKKPTGGGDYKYKFRLAVRGFAQRYGQDYDETYSPTVMLKSVKVVAHLAAHFGWRTAHIDIGCAYMEAPADRKLFIKVAPDLVKAGFCESEYAELGANAYGKKQAGRVWYLYIAGKLEQFGLERSACDVCVFVKWNPERTQILIVLVYVDDFLATGSWAAGIEDFVNFLRAEFRKIKVTSPVKEYIGLEFTWFPESKRVCLSQEQFCSELVAELPEDAKSAAIPLPYSVDYRDCEEFDEAPIWREVGQLRYLADRTRVDLAVGTGLMGSFAARPGAIHKKGVQNLLKYCKGTTDLHLTLGGESAIELEAYSDSNYSTKHDCRPVYGIVLKLGPDAGVVHHRSKKATTMANSVGEAETRAAAETAREIVWMRDMLNFLGQPTSSPTNLYSDSQSAIDIVLNEKNNPRTGCFNRDIQWLRECERNGIVSLKKVATTENIADALTKLLPEDVFKKHVKRLMGETLEK
jgi:transposase InsO family protein